VNRPGTFVKGDPRCWRKGRPKSFDALRELALEIAHEVAQSKGEPVIINGHKATVSELILRKWAMSPDARLQQAFVEVAFGKVPDNIHVSGRGGGPIAVSAHVDVKNNDVSQLEQFIAILHEAGIIELGSAIATTEDDALHGAGDDAETTGLPVPG
jgi:hypothetical protein